MTGGPWRIGVAGALAGALLVSVPLGGRAAPARAGRVIDFGLTTSLTGATHLEGNLALEGYQFWVRSVNSRGGIPVNGVKHKVRLQVFDDDSNVTKSVQYTTQLITDDKVDFLFGPYGTPTTLADSAIAELHKVPMVVGHGAAKEIFARGFKNIFGVISPAAAYGRVMLRAALAQKNPPHSVAILFASDGFSQEVATAARSFALAHGLRVTAYEMYPAYSTNLTALLEPLKSAPPDILLNSGHTVEAIAAMKEARRLGINAKVFAFTVGPATTEFYDALGEDANGVIASAQWTAQERYKGIDVFSTPAEYAKRFRAVFHHPPAYQTASATAAGLAFQYAIEKAGSLDRAKVRAALRSLDVKTFFGTIRFDKTGSNVYKPMATIQIQHGRTVTVYPKSVANRPMVYPIPIWGQRSGH